MKIAIQITAANFRFDVIDTSLAPELWLKIECRELGESIMTAFCLYISSMVWFQRTFDRLPYIFGRLQPAGRRQIVKIALIVFGLLGTTAVVYAACILC
jgi:hypothetical protein